LIAFDPRLAVFFTSNLTSMFLHVIGLMAIQLFSEAGARVEWHRSEN
jgi:hypothetical protein